MNANYYEILGVAPGAEDAVIRAAYRTLMRTYHPDRNDDPQAQSRVREITAAFAVLGDPAKRAAYDCRLSLAFGEEQGWFGADRRAPPPMRKLGLASVALALAVSVAFVVGPDWRPGLPHEVRKAVPRSNEANVAPEVERPAAPTSVAAPVADVPGYVPTPAPEAAPPPLAPPVPAPSAASIRSVVPAPLLPRLDSRTGSPATPAQSPIAAEQPAIAAPESTATASCPQGVPKDASGGCPDDRRAQVERIATGFLEQSMEHADWQKQQLLLSARNRSATSRNLCHSDDCVTDAYMRQIRDTTTIMAGRIPNP